MEKTNLSQEKTGRHQLMIGSLGFGRSLPNMELAQPGNYPDSVLSLA